MEKLYLSDRAISVCQKNQPGAEERLLAGYASTQVSNHLANLQRGVKVGGLNREKGCDSLFKKSIDFLILSLHKILSSSFLSHPMDLSFLDLGRRFKSPSPLPNKGHQ